MKLGKNDLLIFFAIALLLVLVQAKGLVHIAPGDENVYYYMAKSLSEGKLPYGDFFYAHPPLHIFMLSILITVFGVNFFVLKSLELIYLLIASFFLYKTALGLYKNRLNERYANIISALTLMLFLFSFEVMFKATFSMGINLSLMFLMVSFYMISTKRYFAGGIFAGFAGLTRFYTLAPIFAVFVFVFIKKIQERDIRNFLYMLAGFLTTFGATTGVLAIIFGQNFIDPVFNYHLLKPKLPGQRIEVYKTVLKENWPIFLAFLSSIFMKNKRAFRLFYAVVFAHILFLQLISAPEEFYFSIAFPFMAVIGAYSAVDLASSIKISKIFKYLSIAAIIGVFIWNASADILFLEKIGFLEFSQLGKLTSAVALSDPSSKLFGDDSIVPLLALLTNRSIALNYIDSNEKRFTSGLTNFYFFANKLDDVNLSYIIFRENKGLHQILEFRDYTEARCSLDGKYSDVAEGTFLVYKCFK